MGNTSRAHKQAPRPALRLRADVLVDRDGLRVTQLPDNVTLQVEVPGEPTFAIKTRVAEQDGKRYAELTISHVLRSPTLRAALAERTAPGRTTLRVHQLVAAVGRRALLRGSGQGRVGVHHVNGDTGDNRATNLRTLTTKTHSDLHRWLDALPAADRKAYLASIEADPAGLGDLPTEVRAAVLADLAVLEEQEAPTPPEPTEAAQYPSPNTTATDEAARAQKVGPRGRVLRHGKLDPGNGDENPYYPDAERILDLSLSFDRGYMVVSGTLPRVSVATDKEGKTKKDRFGRETHEILWVPVTLTTRPGLHAKAERPVPKELHPYKPFRLEGINGEPRWSQAGMRAFERGQPPAPDLAQRVEATITRYVSFARPVHAQIAAAFVALSYVFPLAHRCPILALHSAAPGSGKSTLIEVFSFLVFNAHRMGVATRAVTVQLASEARCTLLLDEQEKLASAREAGDIVEILNSRTDVGTTYMKMEKEGDGWQPRSFTLFGPTVIANLAGLAPTLRSRSITIEMQPMGARAAQPYGASIAFDPAWAGLRDELYLWAGHHWQAIKATHDGDPAVQAGINRNADLWRLLLAVALHFGGQTLFDALKAEANAAAGTPSSDDLTDAIVVALLKAIDEWESLASHALAVPSQGVRVLPGGRGFQCSLACLHGHALAALEDDQHKLVSSKRVATFCRGLNLPVRRFSWLNGPTGVEIADAAEVRASLWDRFPHLRF